MLTLNIFPQFSFSEDNQIGENVQKDQIGFKN